MKYQIYLNKPTSDFINKLAELKGISPATAIKGIIEDFTTLTKPLENKILEEVKQANESKKK